jgi:hypothetical protein
MDKIEKNVIEFEQHEKYKCGAVTYEVTAHYISEKDSLKEKIRVLLKNNKQKDSLGIANSHRSAV